MVNSRERVSPLYYIRAFVLLILLISTNLHYLQVWTLSSIHDYINILMLPHRSPEAFLTLLSILLFTMFFIMTIYKRATNKPDTKFSRALSLSVVILPFAVLIVILLTDLTVVYLRIFIHADYRAIIYIGIVSVLVCTDIYYHKNNAFLVTLKTAGYLLIILISSLFYLYNHNNSKSQTDIYIILQVVCVFCAFILHSIQITSQTIKKNELILGKGRSQSHSLMPATVYILFSAFCLSIIATSPGIRSYFSLQVSCIACLIVLTCLTLGFLVFVFIRRVKRLPNNRFSLMVFISYITIIIALYSVIDLSFLRRFEGKLLFTPLAALCIFAVHASAMVYLNASSKIASVIKPLTFVFFSLTSCIGLYEYLSYETAIVILLNGVAFGLYIISTYTEAHAEPLAISGGSKV